VVHRSIVAGHHGQPGGERQVWFATALRAAGRQQSAAICRGKLEKYP
jgi:hypothetical protein